VKGAALKNWRYGPNLLALLAAALMIYGMFQPWWSFQLEGSPQTNVYPYLIDGPGSEFIGYRRSPTMELLTGVLIGCIVLIFAASFLPGKSSRISLAVAAVLTLLGGWRLLARVSGVAARFHIPIQGEGTAIYEGFAQIHVWTRIGLGTYLMGAGALIALLAALLHTKVRIGKS
jgi:hypothetical protein